MTRQQITAQMSAIGKPACLADGSCTSCDGRLCRYHQLAGLEADRRRSAVIAATVDAMRAQDAAQAAYPPNGCDLNHNED